MYAHTSIHIDVDRTPARCGMRQRAERDVEITDWAVAREAGLQESGDVSCRRRLQAQQVAITMRVVFPAVKARFAVARATE